MCNYQGYEFGAGRYPDSYCIDGLLHDADSDYLNDESIPCPMCSRDGAISWWTERFSCFVEDDETQDETDRRALEAAISLVDDIRKNRGIAPPIPTNRNLTEGVDEEPSKV